MKKLILTVLLFMSISILMAEQVERDMVVLEIFTGTWCYWCPGATMGAEDLIANGCDVAVVEYHVMSTNSRDPFVNIYGYYRKLYYGVVGIPRAIFDGVSVVSGGSPDSSMYLTYLPIYNARKAINSSFTIDIEGQHTGLDYDVTVTTNKVAASTSTNMVLHLVLTESHIPYSWQGQDSLHWVERLMVPDQYGSALDFSSDSTNIVNLFFTLDESWVADNCELTAFVQDNDTKEVLQGTKVAMPDLLPPPSVDDSNQLFVNSNFIQNYPNPFNSTTVISYRLNRKQVQKADIVIYNVKGQKVKGFSNLPIENDSGSVVWNGLDDNRIPVSNGVYFYQLESKNYKSEIQKMIVIR